MLLSAISYYSILRGVLSPESICKKAKELAYTHVALTDRNNINALPQLIKYCKKYSLYPVVAAEVDDPKSNEVCLLYVNEKKGFTALCKIITERHCDLDFSLCNSLQKNIIDKELIIVTTDNGLLESLNGKLPIFFRIMSYKKPPTDHNALVIPEFLFEKQEDFEIHKLLTAIREKCVISRIPKNALLAPKSIITTWKSIYSDYCVFENHLKLTERLFGDISFVPKYNNPFMPRNDENQKADDDVTLLKSMCYNGARRRYGDNFSSVVTKRIEKELSLIERKGFSSYFLIVEDIVKKSPRTCGRGSGAASCVAYCLGITNVDPIRYDLMFERFLNDRRDDPPDIDIDFAWDERDDVRAYVFEKYGNNHVAMVSNHLTFQPRMAVRETARVFGMTEEEISLINTRIPFMYHYSENSKFEELINSPEKPTLPLDDPWPQILTIAQKILGFPRGMSTHCGGVVITPDQICNHVPVQPSPKGVNIIQWEKDGAEEMGLVKIDLLGNRSLAVIRDAIIGLKRDGYSLNEDTWDPQSDAKTAELLSKGKSMGVFYVESPAMRLLQKKTKCGTFEGLTINSSIIRPAANKFINEYVRRFKGGEYRSDPPLLDKVLKETFGIMVYQEDISKVAAEAAGFSLANAERFRKVITKNSSSESASKWKKEFYKRCKKNGHSLLSINNLWEMFLSFSGYSFAKPHSASYVQVSFQAAWLKAHHPDHFMAAVLGNYGGFYSTQAYINEAMRLGLNIVGVDINSSKNEYYAKKGKIYVGLCQIKGLTEKAKNAIINERKKGSFISINNVLTRTSIKEDDAEKLVISGAFDNLENDTRPVQFWKIRSWYRDRIGGVIPKLKPFSGIELMKMEYKSLGFLVQCHPITLINRDRYKSTIRLKDVEKFKGRSINIIGWCITSKTVMTIDGMPMKFVTFEDETDLCETVMFPNAYQKFVYLLEYHSAFFVTGKVLEEFDVITVEVENISPVKF